MKSLLLNALAAAVMLALFMIGHAFGRKKTLWIFLCLGALTSCTKQGPEYRGPAVTVTQKATVRLYSTNMAYTSAIATADVNGAYYGRIMYSGSVPDCAAGVYGRMELVPGTYKVDIQTEGNPYASRQLTIVVTDDFKKCQFFNVK